MGLGIIKDDSSNIKEAPPKALPNEFGQPGWYFLFDWHWGPHPFFFANSGLIDRQDSVLQAVGMCGPPRLHFGRSSCCTPVEMDDFTG